MAAGAFGTCFDTVGFLPGMCIALDCYDDLFSDFDIREYGERAISRDFLDELRLRMRRKRTEVEVEDVEGGSHGQTRLLLLVPATLRRSQDEELIVQRLMSFFRDRQEHYRNESRRIWRGLAFDSAIGLTLSFGASYAVERLGFFSLFRDFLLIPAWFFVWRGLESLMRNRAEIRDKRLYYERLASASIVFMDLEYFR